MAFNLVDFTSFVSKKGMENSVDDAIDVEDAGATDEDEEDEVVNVRAWLLLLLLKRPYFSSSGPIGSVFILGLITELPVFPDLFGASDDTTNSWPYIAAVSFLTWVSSDSGISCLILITRVEIDGSDCMEVEAADPNEVIGVIGMVV